MIGRITRSADFDEVLGTRPRARSAHFVLHHLARPVGAKLSTSAAPNPTPSVDHSAARTAERVACVRLGVVVPKRHARRAVTRTLIKRQIKAAFDRHAGRLDGGSWVVRLKAPFEVAAFASAASEALRQAARAELDQLLMRVAMP